MKFPLWLQVALTLTVVISGWCLLDDATPAPKEISPQQPASVAAKVADTVHAPRPLSGSDLFPYQGPPHSIRETPLNPTAAPRKMQEIKAQSPLPPFQVAGAWWQEKQRFLLLTDGRQSWLLCQQCRLTGTLHSGEKLNENWQLRAIAPDHLVLRWLPLNDDQRLPLGEMQSKPDF